MRAAALLLIAALGCEGAVEEGARAYAVGEYDRAAATWEPIVQEGSASGVLLYDLGNAHWRRGDAARALAAWRTARQLRPRDAAVVHNLALVRGMLDGVPEPVGEAWPWLEVVTPGEIGLLATLALAAASAGAVWRRRVGTDPDRALTWAGPWLALAGLGLVLAVIAGASWRAERDQPVAVVIDADAVVRDAARPDGGERFLLPPASEVRVRRRAGDFALVETGDGRRGWVAAGALWVAAP